MLSWVMSKWWWCSLRVVIFRSKVMVYWVDGDFSGCLMLSWEAKCSLSFLSGGEFEGVAVMMMRSLWVALGVLWFSSLWVLSLRLLEKHRLSGVFVWWLFPSDPDLCGGGDGGVRWWCRPRFWWCEEVSVGLQRLGSIRTFSSGSTTLFIWWFVDVDRWWWCCCCEVGFCCCASCCCCCCKGGFVKVSSIVVVAKVVVVSIVIVSGCFSKVVDCCVGS